METINLKVQFCSNSQLLLFVAALQFTQCCDEFCHWLELLSVIIQGTPTEEFSLTSTPRRSPAATPTTGTPTALVSMTAESAEAVEAKAALRQVSPTFV